MESIKSIVTTVIVTYNSAKFICKSLDMLEKANKAGILECILVDNASSDNTVQVVKEKHPWVSLIESKRNLGFGKGCNLGASQVQTPYLFMLNPDAAIDSVSINHMISIMESNEKIGLLAPAIKEEDGNFQAAGLMTTPGTMIRTALGMKNNYRDKRVITPGEQPFQTQWVCGAAMLFRTDLFHNLKGFDPRFFLYFEETDLCRRVVSSGIEIWATGLALAYHIGGASAKASGEAMQSSCISEHFYKSRYYYLIKNFGWFPALASETLDYLAEKLRRLKNRSNAGSQNKNRRPFLKLPSKIEVVK